MNVEIRVSASAEAARDAAAELLAHAAKRGGHVALSGGSTPRTIGTFAHLSPRWARYVESGVFEVREMPTSTRSAFGRLRGSAPSSFLTANSTASMRRK